jgi:hypothetical protein
MNISMSINTDIMNKYMHVDMKMNTTINMIIIINVNMMTDMNINIYINTTMNMNIDVNINMDRM